MDLIQFGTGAIEKVHVINSRTSHLISCIVFLGLAAITLRAFLVGDSFHIYRDDVWSKDLSHMISNAINTFELEAARRIIYLGPFFALSDILGHSSLLAEKSVFLFTRFIIGFIPYLVVYKFLSSNAEDIDKNKIFIVSLFAGFFYAYNPLATEKFGASVHGFSFSYALIPLIFYYFDKTLNEKGFYNIFITSLLISLAIAGTQQYLVWLPAFLLAPWFIIVIIRRTRLHKPIFIAVKNSLFLILFFSLISFYWILMAFSLTFTSGLPGPSYVVTDEMLDSLSRSTNLLNVIRLMGVVWPYIQLTPIINQSWWIFLSFVIPIATVSPILFLRKNNLKFYSISFFLIILLVTFFFKGTQPPEGWFYSYLLEIPVVGWMFRVPESNGMFLPFFVMMVISFGFFALLKSNINNKLTYFKIIPLLIVVLSIGLISWPMFTGDFGGIFNSIYFKSGGITNDINSYDKNLISIPAENIAVAGSAHKADILNNTKLYDPAQSSLIFADKKDTNTLNSTGLGIDKIISDDGSDLLQFSDKTSIILKPFDATSRHNPGVVWSKAGTNEPLHGPFHDYLDQLGIANNDFDYGKGLVLTWAEDKLDIPLEVKTDGRYDLYIRYMQNPAGGTLKIYLNNEEINQISTVDQLTKFVWHDIGTFNMQKGKYSLTLENTYGFNAVNIFALIPKSAASELPTELNTLVANKRIIYLLEGNSSFYNIKNKIREDNVFEGTNGTFDKVFDTYLRVPDNATQLSLQLMAKQNPNSTSYYRIKGVEISPIHATNVFVSNFEDAADIKKWNNNFTESQFLSTQTINPISGAKSLRVDVAKSNRGLEGQWNVVGTSLIPVNENVNLKYQIKVSATDVNLFHGKVFYLDKGKNILEALKVDYIFSEPRQTFNEVYTNSYITPQGTKYISLQLWFQTNPEKVSSFLLDDVKIEQTTGLPSLRNVYNTFENLNLDDQKLTIDNDSLRVDLKGGNPRHWDVIQTKPIPVKGNILFSYLINIDGENLDSLQSKVVYSTSDTNKDRHVLYIGPLLPHSETFRNIQISKPSTYTIATQVTTCRECTLLKIKIGDAYKEFSLKNDDAFDVDKVFVFRTNLTAGNTDLRIYSDGATYLYKMVIYPNSYDLALSPHSETFRNIQISKPGTYTVATQVTTCRECTLLKIKMGDAYKEFSLKNDETVNKWFYFTTNLTAGNTDLRIYSDGATNLYKMMIYSDSYPNETLNDLFTHKQMHATLVSFNKIDSTHYGVKVNATKPFVLRLEESYNPSWVAYANGKQYKSMELYPGINGFFIKEKGKFEIRIEYESQRWFYLGSLVTISTIIGSTCYLAWERRRRIRSLLSIPMLGKTGLTRFYFKRPTETREIEANDSTKQISTRERMSKAQKARTLHPDNGGLQSIPYRFKERIKLKVIFSSIVKPEFPLFIALIILVFTPFLLIRGQIFFVNDLMIYMYKLLIVGAVWQFINHLKDDYKNFRKDKGFHV